MIFYFTATGNSLYAAKSLEDGDLRSIAQAVHDRDPRYKGDRIGVVCPVFGHEMPSLVKEFIARFEFETDYFYLILTYGNRHGGAAELTKQFLESQGIAPAYVNVVLMADNFLPAFDMERQKRLDKNVDGQLAAIRTDICRGKRHIAPVTGRDRAAHRAFLSRSAELPPDTFHQLYCITDSCAGCEICTKVCPKGCFTVTDQRACWDPNGCISCMACVHACLTQAIQLNLPEKNPTARYRNPHVRLTELVRANQQNRRC